MTICQYFPKCAGCSSWNDSYLQQKANKISYLQNLLKDNNLILKEPPEFISCAEFGLRHRVDFTIEFNNETKQHNVGFYDLNKNLINIKECLQLSSELQKIYSEFIRFKFFFTDTPIKKGSVRLRTGPNGIKGCWLDFSNLDIKCLLKDQKLLNDILDAGYVVEIGQKGKKLNRYNGILKLGDPVADEWFKTIDYNNNSLMLKSLISDFTQPSWITAESLVKIVLNYIHNIETIKSVLEFGAGTGQFTLSFLREGLSVDACEINESATTQLLTNATTYGLEKELRIHLGNYHKKSAPANRKHDLIFVNPARSGLKNFTDEIITARTGYLIYISCFPETMANDLAKLAKHFELCDIKIVDQFPQTKHFETCAFLKKLN